MLENNVTFQFSIVAKMMDHNAQDLLKGTSLNLTSYRILKTVESFEAISIADLSRHMVADNAQISRAAADLGEKGLVVFLEDPNSKRRKMVALSLDGKALMAKLAPAFTQRQNEVADCLGEDLRLALKDAFEKLTQHFTR